MSGVAKRVLLIYMVFCKSNLLPVMPELRNSLSILHVAVPEVAGTMGVLLILP